MFKRKILSTTSRLQQLVMAVAFYFVLVYAITAIFPAPRAVSLGFAPKTVENVTFLADLSWLEADGGRQIEQQYFDALLQLIAQAESLIVLDMFLFNAWQGPVSETHRALSDELTDALIQQKQLKPSIAITVISDPVNAVYGGLPSTHFAKLRAAGIDVVLTDLTQLQDSNPLYSGLWRWLVRPFGNSLGSALPNPFGPGRVSVRSYLALLNFKANHRKLLVADNASGELHAIVSSANPHDGSSAHRNVALQFTGPAVIDLLVSEKALLSMSDADTSWQAWPESVKTAVQAHPALESNTPKDAALAEQVLASPLSSASLQIVSESRIQQAILALLETAQPDDQIDLLMFYLSDRDVIDALISAHQKGVKLRVLLDVNQDAFGRKKKGVPNRPVAAELVAAGIPVRWCATDGEQCHAKMLYRKTSQYADLLLGSGNYTRRNLDDFNLETNVWLRLPIASAASGTDTDNDVAQGGTRAAINDAATHFDIQWSNQNGRTYSTAYEQFANESVWLKWRYRFMEATGFGTF